MRRKFLFVFLLGLVLAPEASARPLRLMPGVTYDRVLQWTAGGPRAMHIVTTPKPEGLYSLRPLLSNDAIVGRERVSAMQRRVSAQATTVGVNGDFFSWDGGWPSGLLMRGSVVEHQSAVGRAAVGIDKAAVLRVTRVPWFGRWRAADAPWAPIAQLNEPPRPNSIALFTPVWGAATPEALDGTTVVLQPFPPAAPRQDLTGTVAAVGDGAPVAIPPDGAVLVARGTAARTLEEAVVVSPQLTVRIPLPNEWATVTDAVSAGPTLVRDGRPIFNAGEALARSQLHGRHPRTAIGQRADGRIVFVAVDGRRSGWSIGITNWELALALVRYGCVTGFGLDSGGSTTLAFDGQVLNRPSDRGGERAVAEALVIAYSGVVVPALAPTLSPNGDGAGDTEALAYKLVRPSSVSAKIVGPDGSVRELDSGAKTPARYRLSWDGAGTPEGRYHFNVTATDDLGRVSTDDRVFTLDNTLGFLNVTPNGRRISFTLTREARVRVTVETPAGGIVRTVSARRRAAGPVTVTWDGRDGRRKRVRRGNYVVRVAATSELGLSTLRASLRRPGVSSRGS